MITLAGALGALVCLIAATRRRRPREEHDMNDTLDLGIESMARARDLAARGVAVRLPSPYRAARASAEERLPRGAGLRGEAGFVEGWRHRSYATTHHRDGRRAPR